MTSATARSRQSHKTAPILGALVRVAFYVRVSSEEQTERATAKNQVDFLRKKYQPNFEPDSLEPMEFVGMFVDDGQSGAIPIEDRPEGRRLLDLVRARGVDVVVSYRLDRLGRRLGVLLDIHSQLQQHDVAILSATEPFDTRTPIGQFLFQLLGSMAELERETIRERFTIGRDRVARDGKFINGPVPIGYDLEGDRLVPSARIVEQLGCSEADMVRLFFERIAAGESAAAVTVWLRAHDVPSTMRYIRRDGTERETTRPAWSSQRMQDIVHSSMYYGERQLNYSGSVLRQDIPALVSRELWNDANATLRNRISKFNAGQNEGYVYLLSGKAFCAECGRSMLGNYQIGNQRWKRGARLYYVCSSARVPRARRRPEDCMSGRNHNGWTLEGFVLEAIDEYVTNPEAALKILREQTRERQGTSADQEEQVKALRLRLADYERGKSALLALVSRGQITQDEYLKQTHAAAEEASAVRHELELREAQDALGSVIETRLLESVRVLHELREGWSQARANDDRVALRAMVQQTLRELYVSKDGAVRMVFTFSSPASRENNQSHYRRLWRENSGAGAAVIDLELRRSLAVAKPA